MYTDVFNIKANKNSVFLDITYTLTYQDELLYYICSQDKKHLLTKIF